MTVKIHSNAIRKSPQISQNLRPRLVALKRAKDKRKRSFRSSLKVQQKVAKGGTRSNYVCMSRSYCITKGGNTVGTFQSLLALVELISIALHYGKEPQIRVRDSSEK